MAPQTDRRTAGGIIASVAAEAAKRRRLTEAPQERRDPVTGRWRYVTSKDMREIERLTDTPEERETKLAAFDANVRRAHGDYDRSGLPGQHPTFRIRIHKRSPRPEEMGVTEGIDPYAVKRQRWHE